MSDNDLQNIYLKYRDQEMRGTTVEKEYDRIQTIPDSENQARVNQLLKDGMLSSHKMTLDIGSGLGIFPSTIRPYLHDVCCIEPNKDCADFIVNKLDIPCFSGFYEPSVFGYRDFVTAVHVLEHIRDPIAFLQSIALGDLKNDGTIYIEVPDSEEFMSLPNYHDEFNSTHLFFYNISTLAMIVKKAGLTPYLIRTIKYPERNLSRIYLLCKNQ